MKRSSPAFSKKKKKVKADLTAQKVLYAAKRLKIEILKKNNKENSDRNNNKTLIR